MNLEENIKEYKSITLNILNVVKAEEYEKLDEMFKQRQVILDNTKKWSYTKEELSNLYFLYEIEKLDKILASQIEAKKNALIDKIKENEKRKIAARSYNNLSGRAVFLSKEI